MKIDEGRILLLFSGILTGVVLTAFLINTKANPTRFLTLREYQNTSAQLNALRLELNGLYKDYGELNSKLYSYENGTNPNDDVVNTLEKELENLRKLYGSSEVEGPGIKITVKDRYKPVYIDEQDLLDSIVHDYDLRRIVNDLKAAGAEAISINGIRIHMDTAITCEGPIIQINDEVIVPPFKIFAIGDPDGLLYSITTEDSYFNFLRFRMLPITTERLTNITIPAGRDFSSDKYINEAK